MSKVIIVKYPDKGVAIIHPASIYGDEEGKVPYAQEKALIPFLAQGLEWFVIDKADLPSKVGLDSREQLYWDGNEVKIDSDYSKILMHDGTIRRKHMKWLNEQINTELQKTSPDLLKIQRWQNEYRICKEKKPKHFSRDVFWLEKALIGLERSPNEKSEIRQALQSKINELKK